MNRIICENSRLYENVFVFYAFIYSDYFTYPKTLYLNLEQLKLNEDIEKEIYFIIFCESIYLFRKKHLILNKINQRMELSDYLYSVKDVQIENNNLSIEMLNFFLTSKKNFFK